MNEQDYFEQFAGDVDTAVVVSVSGAAIAAWERLTEDQKRYYVNEVPRNISVVDWERMLNRGLRNDRLAD